MRHANVLEVNEFLVFDFVRAQSETTRPEIARELGLSAASVSRIVGRLLKDDLVSVADGSRDAPGRPPSRIRFNHHAGAVLAIDLGGTKCHGALADMNGDVLAEEIQPTARAGSPYETLIACIEVLQAEAARRGLPIVAAAVGVPAVLDPETGRATRAPNVHWEDFDLAGRLTGHLDVPFTIENDVNLAALAQAWRGAGRNVRDFVTISIGTGIGAGVVADGRLMKGRHNSAGEIGLFVFDRDQFARSSKDGIGPFEELASGPAIARRAQAALAGVGAPDSTLRGRKVTSEAVFEAAAQGDPTAMAAIDELVDNLALAIIAVVGLVDPERIILDGAVGRSLEPYLDRIARQLDRHLPVVPELSVSELGPNATVVGAIAAAVHLTRRRARPSSLLGAVMVDAL
ncbi:MAG: glucokinase [Chloroflexota bacterium]|nr:glucokinase [Chloroflexota bacterium]